MIATTDPHDICILKLKCNQISSDTPWVRPVISIIQGTILRSPSSEAVCSSCQIIANFPPDIISALNPFTPLASVKHDPSRPFSYIFSSLVVAEIQATIPSLMETLASESYTTTAVTLAGCLEVLTIFIRTLITTGEDEEAAIADLMPPSLLLKLHQELSNTMALLLEYLRDRWDASHAGASGLHPSARTAPEIRPGERAPLSLTWENPTVEVAGDPIIVAAIRCLGCWIRDDEDPNLRRQASGCMDMLLVLYQQSIDGDEKIADFRPSILMILQGILDEAYAVEAFLENDGWKILMGDVKESLRSNVVRKLETRNARYKLLRSSGYQLPRSRDYWGSANGRGIGSNLPDPRVLAPDTANPRTRHSYVLKRKIFQALDGLSTNLFLRSARIPRGTIGQWRC
jgi:hypothetical protein